MADDEPAAIRDRERTAGRLAAIETHITHIREILERHIDEEDKFLTEIREHHRRLDKVEIRQRIMLTGLGVLITAAITRVVGWWNWK